MAEKKIISYRIVNDDINVSLRTFELLISGLYPEELYQASTAELIASSPQLVTAAKSKSLVPRVAAVAAVSVLAGAAYLLMRKLRN